MATATVERYAAMVGRYAPHAPHGPLSWAYSSDPTGWSLPRQGWKVHLSATVQSAPELLERSGGFLEAHGAPFKVLASLGLIDLANSGLFFGYSQIGKVVTVYATDQDNFVALIDGLCEVLEGLACPAIPFDRRVRADRPVFYRYGSFGGDGRSDELLDPDGVWHADERLATRHHPPWVDDPLDARSMSTPLGAVPVISEKVPNVLAYAALSQRGKGGVYLALDFDVTPARRCVLKEGRRHGETGLTGHDGRDLIEAEQRVLTSLADGSVRVAKLERTYELEENAYSVLEHVEGESLADTLTARGFGIGRARGIALAVAKEVYALHRADWIWRDCKPTNVLVEPGGSVRVIDFEGACRRSAPLRGPYGSPGYMAPMPPGHRATAADDVYSLGMVFVDLFCGLRYPRARSLSRAEVQRVLPRRVAGIVDAMLSAHPLDRPSSGEVVARLLSG